MKTAVVRMSGALSAALLLAAILGGCGGASDQEAQQQAEVFPVETAQVMYSEFAPTLSYTGSVMAGRKALLGAEVQGRVQTFHVDTGDEVRSGDLLVELAGGQLTQAEARYQAAEKDWRRTQALLDEGAVTQQSYDHAEAAFTAAKAAYETVLESARIRAPFDGVITARYLDEGELFVMMSPSPTILEVSNLENVKIEIEIGEKERKSARVGLDAVVTVDAYPDDVFHGTINRIDPGLDTMSRTSTADIVLENPGQRIRPGMFANVELELSAREALLMPREALVRQEGTGSFFAYVASDGVAHRRNLTLGDGIGDRIEVLDGLSAGDRVVTAGRYRLHDGANVKIVDNAGDAGGAETTASAGSSESPDAGLAQTGGGGTEAMGEEGGR